MGRKICVRRRIFAFRVIISSISAPNPYSSLPLSLSLSLSSTSGIKMRSAQHAKSFLPPRKDHAKNLASHGMLDHLTQQCSNEQKQCQDITSGEKSYNLQAYRQC
jgi:hypothetical protein